MIRKYYRILTGNPKESFQVADISLCMTIIIKYILKTGPGSVAGIATGLRAGRSGIESL